MPAVARIFYFSSTSPATVAVRGHHYLAPGDFASVAKLELGLELELELME